MRTKGAKEEFVMSHSLPSRPSLKRLRRQARQLLVAIRHGSPAALRALRRHPRHRRPSEVRLADAQLLIARRYGFDSWPKLHRTVAGIQLRRAAWRRDTATVRELLSLDRAAAADAGVHPRWGRPDSGVSVTALQVASERGSVPVVAALVDAGADPGERAAYGGWTPMQLAAHWQRRGVVRLLRQRGEPFDAYSAAMLGDTDALHQLENAGAKLALVRTLNDATPLHLAGTPAAADLLLRSGADPDLHDVWGNTAVAAALGRGDRGWRRPVGHRR